jgi:exocyst complex protein 7
MSLTRFPYTSGSSQHTASTSSSIALEQANADLLLLQQSLSRSSKISDRMSTVLGELDDRLAKLEKSLVPIYKETGKLTRVSKSQFLALTLQSTLLANAVDCRSRIYNEITRRTTGTSRSCRKGGRLDQIWVSFFCRFLIRVHCSYSPPSLSNSPKQGDLKPYLAAIDRLVAASEALRKTDAKGQAATLVQMVSLAATLWPPPC